MTLGEYYFWTYVVGTGVLILLAFIERWLEIRRGRRKNSSRDGG